jgi:hydroxypyruvate isomerase
VPRFAANLSMMFNEVPFLDRFAAAAEAGFQGVEFLFPYEHPPETVAAKLRENHVENVLFNMPPGNWAAGERGIGCLPGREEEFRTGVEKALTYAERLGTPRIHAMSGIAPANADRRVLRDTFVSNLRWAAEKLAARDIMLLVEAINTRDIPGYFLNTQAESYALCTEINAPNLKMQMDLYHMQIVEGDLAMKLRQHMGHCGHIQIAGVPARNEPDTGEVNYPYLFRLIDELGYSGWIGCEYRPAGQTAAGLGWLNHTR